MNLTDIQVQMEVIRQQRGQLREQLVALRARFEELEAEETRAIVQAQEDSFQELLSHNYPIVSIASATQGYYPRKGGQFIVSTTNQGFLDRIDVKKGGKFGKHNRPFFYMHDGRILKGNPSDMKLAQIQFTAQGIRPYDAELEEYRRYIEEHGEDEYEEDSDSYMRWDYELLNY